jgi:hypothetical protein
MNSDTSTDNNIKYLDKNGNKLLSEEKIKLTVKKQSSDNTTDYYFNMIANEDKINNESSENSTSEKSKYSSSSSSKKINNSSSESIKSNTSVKYEKLLLSDESNKKEPTIPIYNKEPMIPTYNNKKEVLNNNNFDTSKVSVPNLNYETNISTMTPQQVKMKKIELLRRLCEIKSKGFQLTKEYDFNSSIEEMEYEYSLLKSFADKKNGIKIYKSCLLNGISIVEFLNDKYDPFDFKLSGWSEHMSIEVDSYDDILEELYEKYKSSGAGMPVEVKFLLLIIASGAAFHFSKTQLGNIPGASSITSGVLGKMMSSNKKSNFMTPQEINLENQKKILKEREQQLKNVQLQQQQKYQKQQYQYYQQQQEEEEEQLITTPPKQNNQSFKSTSRDLPNMKSNENVQDILNRIKVIQNNTTETQEETTSNNDRLISDSTISDINKKPVNRNKKPKKSILSINT